MCYGWRRYTLNYFTSYSLYLTPEFVTYYLKNFTLHQINPKLMALILSSRFNRKKVVRPFWSYALMYCNCNYLYYLIMVMLVIVDIETFGRKQICLNFNILLKKEWNSQWCDCNIRWKFWLPLINKKKNKFYVQDFINGLC